VTLTLTPLFLATGSSLGILILRSIWNRSLFLNVELTNFRYLHTLWSYILQREKRAAFLCE
jgi:hypothetical protein